MHQLINNKKVKISLILFFFIFLSSYYSNSKFEDNKLFYIEEIKYENNNLISDELLDQYFGYLINKNILFLNQGKFKNIYKDLPIINNIRIKKIYPNKIKIIIEEKKLIAKNQSKFLLEDWTFINQDLIQNNNDKNIPLINEFEIGFIEVYKNLKKYNLQNKKVSEFYMNKIGRWDITFSDNKKIKLPEKNVSNSLKNFFAIENQTEYKNFKSFDYRISNKLILE